MVAFASPTPLQLLSTSTSSSLSKAPRCTEGPRHVTPRATMSRRDFVTLVGVGAVTVAGLLTSPTPVLADKTAQSMKKSFERYYPRIAAGGDTLRSVGDLLGNGDVAGAKEAVEAKEFDIKFRRALNIYATSFSDSTVSQQSRDLLYCAERLFNELESVKKATEVDEEVMQHFTVAKEAYGKYVRIARLPKDLLVGFPEQ